MLETPKALNISPFYIGLIKFLKIIIKDNQQENKSYLSMIKKKNPQRLLERDLIKLLFKSWYSPNWLEIFRSSTLL